MSDTAWEALVGGRRFIHTLLEFCTRLGITVQDIENRQRPYVCIGTDSFANLNRWYFGEEIPKLCNLVVVQGREDKVVHDNVAHSDVFVPARFCDISASKIRKAMLGRNWTHYLEDVEKFDKGEKTAKELGWA